MDELFVQLCAGVAVALEALKPSIKALIGINNDQTAKERASLYQAVVWLLAALIGVAGAFAFQVDVTPAWIGVPDAAGFVFTGIIAAFGSEVAHRILEVLAAISHIFQNRAEGRVG